MEVIYEDNQLYFEPQKGTLENKLSADNSRILDMGTYAQRPLRHLL